MINDKHMMKELLIGVVAQDFCTAEALCEDKRYEVDFIIYSQLIDIIGDEIGQTICYEN